jgi:hypothetical protein
MSCGAFATAHTATVSLLNHMPHSSWRADLTVNTKCCILLHFCHDNQPLLHALAAKFELFQPLRMQLRVSAAYRRHTAVEDMKYSFIVDLEQ